MTFLRQLMQQTVWLELREKKTACSMLGTKTCGVFVDEGEARCHLIAFVKSLCVCKFSSLDASWFEDEIFKSNNYNK